MIDGRECLVFIDSTRVYPDHGLTMRASTRAITEELRSV